MYAKVMLLRLYLFNLHRRLEVYIGAQYARNKVILVEILQRQNVRANTFACA